MQIIDAFHTYAWAMTGELITDGITPFNITYAIKKNTHAVALKVSHLVTVESRGVAMSFADAKQFQESDVKFPVTTAACGHHLAAHSIMVDLMMGETAPFTVEYQQCVQQLRPHFDLSLAVHYGDARGEAYLMALQILYWLTQQFLYFLTKRKFGENPLLPAFSTLMQHLHTKTLDGFLSCLPASWMEHVAPSSMMTPGATGQGRGTNQVGGNAGGTLVTNMNYLVAFQKCWQAAGHNSITQLLQAYTGEGTLMVPKMGDQMVCLSWMLRGWCFDNCGCSRTHKQASAALITQVHALLDSCHVPPAN